MNPEFQDPPRIRDTEDGALLRSADAVEVPAGVQARVRVALAEKLETRRPAWALRVALGLGGMLVVGGALAAVLLPSEPEATPPKIEVPVQKPQPRPPQEKATPPVEPEAPPPPVAAAPVRRVAPARAVDEPTPVATPEPVAAAPTPVPAPVPVPAPAFLRVQWQGRREVALEIRKANDTTFIKGTVNGVKVELQHKGALLHGHLGEDTLHLVLRGFEGGGTARGHETAFSLFETERGLLLRGTVPGHTVRVELEDKKLSWFPGCENELGAREPGVYAGACVQGRAARVELPKALFELTPMARMVLLGLVLSERDPLFDSDTTRLFPPLSPQR